MSLEKIINEAWEIKDQVNQNSGQELKDAINQIINDLDSGKSESLKKLMENGLHINILKKLYVKFQNLSNGKFKWPI